MVVNIVCWGIAGLSPKKNAGPGESPIRRSKAQWRGMAA